MLELPKQESILFTTLTMDLPHFLKIALEQAEKAHLAGNVPIGAIIVNESGEIISVGANEIKTNFDVTAHAEVVALRRAGQKAMTKYHAEPTWLFTTLEPCVACSFFITRSNVKHVVWALSDPYAGGIDDLMLSPKLGDKIKAIELIAEPDPQCRERSSALMQEYFLQKGDAETARFFV